MSDSVLKELPAEQEILDQRSRFDSLYSKTVDMYDTVPEGYEDIFGDDDDLFMIEVERPSIKDSCTNTEGCARAEIIASLTERARRMQEALLKDVVGQYHAVCSVVSGYFRSELTALTDDDRKAPTTFLFAGAPGVGKTLLAQKFAEHLGGLPFERFDMSEYADQDSAVEFCGSDKVYSGSKSGNFTSFVSKNPRSVVLFDEIEKAHISVIHLFLQMLDAGTIRDSHTDCELSLKDTVLVFTTNAGRQLYEGRDVNDLSITPRQVILSALEKDIDPSTGNPYFPAAICSRFATGNVLLFNKMSAASLCAVAEREINRVTLGFEKRLGVTVSVDRRVFPAVIFSEGGRADGRGVRSRAEAFINEELYEFFRLISSEQTECDLCKLRRIVFDVEIPEDPDVRALFFGDGNDEIAVVSSKALPDVSGQGVTFVCTETARAVDDAVKRRDIKAVFVDLDLGRRQKGGEYLNAEDISSKGRKIFFHIREKYPDMPVYMLESDALILNNEEKHTFLKLGATGFVSIVSDNTDFAEDIRKIAESLHYTAGTKTLTRSNKHLVFDTAQKLNKDKTVGYVRLFDLRTVTAVDAEDSERVLSNSVRPDVRLDDVVGCAEAKKELKYFIEYLKNPKKYAASGVRAPKGVLLHGPSGTGKTMLARAVAGESDVTFITAEGNEFLKKYVGEGPKKVHELFKTARKYAPSILFIDEIDAIGKVRTGDSNGSEETLTALLTEMDGFNSDPAKPVFILAATNFAIDGDGRALDPALVRRFDRRILLELPTRPDRRALLNRKVAENRAFGISEKAIESTAVRSTGMSLAQLNDVLELSLRTVLSEGKKTVTDRFLEEAFETYQGGEAKGWDEESLSRVALHEAGHAYVSYINGNVPSYVTVVARGIHGGYVQGGSTEEKRIYTKNELLCKIREALGGRAAEIAVYGDEDGLSTAAVSDLTYATEQAMRLVCIYGMETRFGMSVVAEPTSSPQVKAAVDSILKSCLEEAVDTVRGGLPTVMRIKEALLTKNRLDGDELRDVING